MAGPIEVTFAIIDPDSAIPAGRVAMGAFVDGRRVSMREAAEAHKRGERFEMRTIERPPIPARTRAV